MPGAVFLRGDDITLRTIEEEDLEFLRDGVNDPDVREGLTTAFPFNAEQEREYFEERISDDDEINLAICEDSEAQRASDPSSGRRGGETAPNETASPSRNPRDAEIVGTIGLHDLEQQAGHCEVGIWLAPEFHGRGYGTEASRLATDFAFRELRMHRVMARVLATNPASARIWEKLGFTEEGVHRDEAFTGGEYVDIRYFAVLEDEWRSE
ncbi:GNAT family N-acetyltransferase [Halorussus litoreus]|uniref:GNAT family N-acetyltransferase n=1 Tax=Halorussus litoreus TaxID=1710536 RepID=UPI000E279B38|nr:GNAT family protein [Halorussus litoreus]